MDKKTYICPNVEIHRVMVESQLLADSEDGKAFSGLSRNNRQASQARTCGTTE